MTKLKSANILITNDINSYCNIDIAKVDMVLVITNDGKFFNIIKNKVGITPAGMGLPISILPQVIANPKGKIMIDWT